MNRRSKPYSDIAEGTFKAHMSHIYEKCGVANRRELVALLGAR